MSMTALTQAETLDTEMERLRVAGAAGVDAVQWHYIETLAARSRNQSKQAQALLQAKLQAALTHLDMRMAAANEAPVEHAAAKTPSPMTLLLQEMAPPPATLPGKASFLETHRESPRVQQFRKQLRKISVQKQVSHAIAQAPQNAGPINSHILVLRALGLMRELSPDYLQRFVAYVNTLMVLENAVTPTATKTVSRKTSSPRKPRTSA